MRHSFNPVQVQMNRMSGRNLLRVIILSCRALWPTRWEPEILSCVYEVLAARWIEQDGKKKSQIEKQSNVNAS